MSKVVLQLRFAEGALDLGHQLQDKRRRGHRLHFEMVLDGYTVWPQPTLHHHIEVACRMTREPPQTMRRA